MPRAVQQVSAVLEGSDTTRFFVRDLESWLDLLIYDLIPVYQIRKSYQVINNIRRNTKIYKNSNRSFDL